jgi:hypothetical protein
MIEQGLRVQALKRRLEGVRTDDPRYWALNDQLSAEEWKWNRITVQALRHGMDADYLGDKLDEHHARDLVEHRQAAACHADGLAEALHLLTAGREPAAADNDDGMVDE